MTTIRYAFAIGSALVLAAGVAGAQSRGEVDPRYGVNGGGRYPATTYDPRYDSRSTTYDPRYDARSNTYDARLDPRSRMYDPRYALYIAQMQRAEALRIQQAQAWSRVEDRREYAEERREALQERQRVQDREQRGRIVNRDQNRDHDRR